MQQYLEQKKFSYKNPKKIGILLVNLGTPSEPTPVALKKYLREFLSDTRVIETSKTLWFIILNFIVLVFRPKISAKKYKSIWTKQGSPLLVYCKKIVKKLEKKFSTDYSFVLAMNYGEPSITSGLEFLRKQNCVSLFVLPLYPQYSSTTTAAVFDNVSNYFQKSYQIPHFSFLHSYYAEPLYIQSVAQSIQKIRKNKAKILFSYHGTPVQCLLKGDSYYFECCETTRLVAEKLKLKKNEHLTCFQSRFGKQRWLLPYTDEIIKKIAKKEQEIFIVCPGFAVDCLETLEEIANENKQTFFKAGGKKYHYIPCLNDGQAQLELLSSLIEKNTKIGK